MFEILIALGIGIFILLVVYFPKQKRKPAVVNNDAKIALQVLRIKHDLGIKTSFESKLVHQTAVLDEVARKLLVVNNANFTAKVYSLDAIRSLKVVNTKTAITPGKESKKTTAVTKSISLELLFEDIDSSLILVVYDNKLHAPAQLEVMEKHAWFLHEQITKAMIHQMLSA